MNKEFVPYEEALELKQLGFDESCFATYNTDKKVSRNPSHNIEDLPIKEQPYYWNNSKIHKDTVTAPLYQQVFRWFREKYGLYMELFVDDDKQFGFMITRFTENDRVDLPMFWSYKTYEEAELACLRKLIEIVKNF